MLEQLSDDIVIAIAKEIIAYHVREEIPQLAFHVLSNFPKRFEKLYIEDLIQGDKNHDNPN